MTARQHIPSVEDARARYLRYAELIEYHGLPWVWQWTEAASVALDMAMAAESEERIRRSVAW